MDLMGFDLILSIFDPKSLIFTLQTSVSARCCELKWGQYRRMA
jgi:hypothetical protein